MTATDRLAAVLREALAATPFLLEEVTVSPAGRRRVVRVVVDHELGPVETVDTPTAPLSLDDVAEATRAVSAALDDSDVLGEAPYTLEVTSPGVSRPLTAPRHFQRNVGRLVTVRTGEQTLTGRITSAGPDGFTLEVPASKKVQARSQDVPYAVVERAQVEVEFNRAQDAGGPVTEDAHDAEEES